MVDKLWQVIVLPAMPTPYLYYFVYGFCLQSETPLPELIPASAGQQNSCEVTIRLAPIEIPSAFQDKEGGYLFQQEIAYLYWHHTGLFRVEKGQEIMVQAAPGVADSLLRPFLLGPVLAALLHQREHLVLHASAVSLQDGRSFGRSVAFVGQSHSGKSTMASALFSRGHSSLADDIIAVPLDLSQAENSQLQLSRPSLFPGLPHLKLRPPTISALGQDIESLHHWHPSHDGYLMRLPDQLLPENTQPVELCSIYVLEKGASLNIEVMDSPAALMALANNSFCLRALDAEGRAKNFRQCALLVQQVPVFRLQRPRDLNLLGEVAQLVEDHQRQLVLAESSIQT